LKGKILGKFETGVGPGICSPPRGGEKTLGGRFRNQNMTRKKGTCIGGRGKKGEGKGIQILL